jgi:hypothetical protein
VRFCRRLRRPLLLGVSTGLVAFCISASAALAVNQVTWSCRVGPSSWCQFTTAHDYIENVVENSATFPVATRTKFIFSGTRSDVAEAGGTILNTSNVLSSLYLADWYQDSSVYPLVANPDPANTRTFKVISYYY